jgi:hypothetical protein
MEIHATVALPKAMTATATAIRIALWHFRILGLFVYD